MAYKQQMISRFRTLAKITLRVSFPLFFLIMNNKGTYRKDMIEENLTPIRELKREKYPFVIQEQYKAAWKCSNIH
jgi:hypothetical protein